MRQGGVLAPGVRGLVPDGAGGFPHPGIGVGGEVFVEKGGDDFGDGFVLEDAAVAPVREGGQRRFDDQGVFGEATIGAIGVSGAPGARRTGLRTCVWGSDAERRTRWSGGGGRCQRAGKTGQ